MGNGQWAMGNGNKKKLDVFHKGTMPDAHLDDAQCPMPNAQCPITTFPKTEN
ncbi:hypothetical protein [Tolypothrix sp. VBCCA 56010]|uniref:hypothetical protein n=1 Tax=Tolypothrix sp. VBCCA 56010 TaxID=3137731 RepID=UPI003D7C8D86